MLASILKRMNMFILFKMLASMLASIFARQHAGEHARQHAGEHPQTKKVPMYLNGTVHTSACMLASMLASMLV